MNFKSILFLFGMVANLIAQSLIINENFSLGYIAPSGWNVSDTATKGNRFSFQIKNPAFKTIMFVTAYKCSTNDEAKYKGGNECFEILEAPMKFGSGFMPRCYSFFNSDTLVNGVSIKETTIKEIDSTLNYTYVNVVRTQARGNILHCIKYFPTDADFTANYQEYSKNWTNLSLFTPQVLAKRLTPTNIQYDVVKGNLVDLQGRLLTKFNVDSKKEIANQEYINFNKTSYEKLMKLK